MNPGWLMPMGFIGLIVFMIILVILECWWRKKDMELRRRLRDVLVGAYSRKLGFKFWLSEHDRLVTIFYNYYIERTRDLKLK